MHGHYSLLVVLFTYWIVAKMLSYSKSVITVFHLLGSCTCFFFTSGRKEFRLYSPRLCELLRTHGMEDPDCHLFIHPNGLISYMKGIREDGEFYR